MSDKVKTILAIILFASSLILPIIIALSAGVLFAFQKLDDPYKLPLLIVGIAAFLIPLGLSVWLFFRVKDLSWLAASFPYFFSMLYSVSLLDVVPDVAPFVTNVDDGAMVTIGAILSFVLAQRRNPNTPKWIFIPLVAAAVYTFLGGVIPGGLDELLVQGLAFLTYIYGSTRQLPQAEEKEQPSVIIEK